MSTMNRLNNIKNPYQGTEKKVLCVCSAGLLRSPTSAFVLQKEFGWNTRAVGASKEYALIPIDDVLINWADLIIFMEPYHLAETKWHHGEALEGKETLVLDLEDKYSRMDKVLQVLILEKVSAYLKEKEDVQDA